MKTPAQLPPNQQRAADARARGKAAPIPEELAPIKMTYRSWEILTIILVFFVWICVIPVVYTLKVGVVPALDNMQRSTGVLSFKGVHRGGAHTVIAHSDDSKGVFSCRSYAGGTHSCINPKYRDKTAEIWWFWATTSAGEKQQYAAQIVIDGEVIRSREKTLESIRSGQLVALALASLYFVIFVE